MEEGTRRMDEGRRSISLHVSKLHALKRKGGWRREDGTRRMEYLAPRFLAPRSKKERGEGIGDDGGRNWEKRGWNKEKGERRKENGVSCSTFPSSTLQKGERRKEKGGKRMEYLAPRFKEKGKCSISLQVSTLHAPKRNSIHVPRIHAPRIQGP